MKSIFEFDDYRDFLKAWIKQRPKGGRGALKKFSELLRVHSTLISHILRGSAQLNLEQATELAEYIGLSDLETDCFLDMVQIERAGTQKLRKRIAARIEVARKRSLQLSERLRAEQGRILSESDQAIFYSSWHFSAIRLLATLGETDSQEIRKKLNLSSSKANEAIEFLTRTGICEKRADGKIKAVSSVTHLGAESPHVWKHHQTWRIKGMERHFGLDDEEIMYSAPLSISSLDMARFRERIVSLVQDLKETVEETDPEIVACLNIDWFKLVDQR